MKNVKHEIIDNLSKIFGCSFISLKNYESSTSGEISNHTINIGFSYENAVKKDIEILKATSYGKDELLEAARKEVLTSLENTLNGNLSNQSKGQIDAYIHVSKAVKLHIDKEELYIYGMAISKSILREGVYKKVNSRPLTLAKKEISRELNLSTSKYRMFKFSNLMELKISGKVLSMGKVEMEGFEA